MGGLGYSQGLAQLAADGSAPLERLVAKLLSVLEFYEAARRTTAGSTSTPRTVADAAHAAREKRALRQAAVVECLLEHAAFALCGALKAAAAAGELLTPFACSVVYLMGRNRTLSIPRMDHTLYCIRRRASGGTRVSRRASALLGVAGLSLATHRPLLCGGPTYLLTRVF